MKFYKITDIEQLTGIKAHTIRIWEKRYNLIQPNRTDTNIRRYDDVQLKKILNVSTLLNNGYKISKIAALKEKEVHELISGLQKHETNDAINLTFINELTASMLDFNEQAFEKTFSVVVNRLGLYEAMSQVIYPLLNKIGIMWATNNAVPVQEHFASNIIKRKLMSAIDGLAIPTKKKKFLLFLPPDEYHEIGLLFTNYIIRAKGYHTIYLGANVPYENIKEVVKATKPDCLITFFVVNHSSQDLSHLIKTKLLSLSPNLLISGHPDNFKHVKNLKKVSLLTSPKDLLNFL